MNKKNHTEFLADLTAKWKKDLAERESKIRSLMETELIDEDGYPTPSALEIVSTWHWSEPNGYFDFIKSIWWMPDWGWSEGNETDERDDLKLVYRYHISTGGWSGNEAIISAMQSNDMMWHLNWVQSRRGGHYIFELREFKSEN